MNLKELLAAKAALDAEIASARKIESADALRRVHALVSEFGFTSQQVFHLVCRLLLEKIHMASF